MKKKSIRKAVMRAFKKCDTASEFIRRIVDPFHGVLVNMGVNLREYYESNEYKLVRRLLQLKLEQSRSIRSGRAEKMCNKCKRTLSIREFSTYVMNGKSHYRPRCMDCMNKYYRAYNKTRVYTRDDVKSGN